MDENAELHAPQSRRVTASHMFSPGSGYEFAARGSLHVLEERSPRRHRKEIVYPMQASERVRNVYVAAQEQVEVPENEEDSERHRMMAAPAEDDIVECIEEHSLERPGRKPRGEMEVPSVVQFAPAWAGPADDEADVPQCSEDEDADIAGLLTQFTTLTWDDLAFFKSVHSTNSE